MIVEEDATPIGLGIKDGDILAWIPRFNIQNTDETDEIVRNFGGPALLETIRYKTMRKEKQVSGQNIFLRGEDGGHLLPQFKEPPKTVSKSNTLADLENMSLKDEQVQYIDETAEMTVYVGPVRNGASFLPIVEFQRVSPLNSVEELINCWHKHTRHHLAVTEDENNERFKNFELPPYLLYNNKKCHKKMRIKDVGMVMERIYFSLPTSLYLEDDRSLDQILDFIGGEGDNEKRDDKKKKKKKKKATKDQSTTGEKSTTCPLIEGALPVAVKEKPTSQSNPVQLDEDISPAHDLPAFLPAPIWSEEMQHYVGHKLEVLDPAKQNLAEAEEKGREKKKCAKKKKGNTKEERGSSEIKTNTGVAEESKETKEDNLLVGKETSSSSNGDQLRSQKSEIEEKQAIIQQNRDFLEQLVDVKGKEMATLITSIEAAEDEKNEKLKEKGDIEQQISELQTQHGRIVEEVKEKDKAVFKLNKKRKNLEAYIDTSVDETKKKIAALEAEVKNLQISLPPLAPKVEASASDSHQQPNLQLLEFINMKIEAREQELECPVCLETASIPIFACNDMHLICSNCRPKVKCQTSNFHPFWFSRRCRPALSAGSPILRKRRDIGTQRRLRRS